MNAEDVLYALIEAENLHDWERFVYCIQIKKLCGIVNILMMIRTAAV